MKANLICFKLEITTITGRITGKITELSCGVASSNFRTLLINNMTNK